MATATKPLQLFANAHACHRNYNIDATFAKGRFKVLPVPFTREEAHRFHLVNLGNQVRQNPARPREPITEPHSI